MRSSTDRPRDCQVLASQTVTMATSGPRPHWNHAAVISSAVVCCPACPGLVPSGRGPTERSRSDCAAVSAGEAFGDASREVADELEEAVRPIRP